MLINKNLHLFHFSILLNYFLATLFDYGLINRLSHHYQCHLISYCYQYYFLTDRNLIFITIILAHFTFVVEICPIV